MHNSPPISLNVFGPDAPEAPEAYTAAVIQLCSTTDIEANLSAAAAFLEQAAGAGAAFATLPENFSFLGEEEEKLDRGEEIAQRSEAFLIEQSAAHNLVILGGGYAVPHPSGRAYNRALLTGPEGILARYDKIHLFDVDLPDRSYRESLGTEAGQAAALWRGGRLGQIGISICYDLRFPELYRGLSKAGAEVLCVPAAFTAITGEAHWEILLRARAIENTCYLLAPAQTGQHAPNRKSHGHAMIVDPWGEILGDAGTEPGVALGQIDPKRLREVRNRIPSLEHRRL